MLFSLFAVQELSLLYSVILRLNFKILCDCLYGHILNRKPLFFFRDVIILTRLLLCVCVKRPKAQFVRSELHTSFIVYVVLINMIMINIIILLLLPPLLLLLLLLDHTHNIQFPVQVLFTYFIDLLDSPGDSTQDEKRRDIIRLSYFLQKPPLPHQSPSHYTPTAISLCFLSRKH